MAVANVKWFDSNVYMGNKLAKMPAGTTMDSLVAQMEKAGYSGPEGYFRHFLDWGHTEDVSPSAGFDAQQYYTFKAAKDYYGGDVSKVTADDVNKMMTAIHTAGMDAWTHYQKFGTSEMVNASNSFDTAAYLQAKSAAMGGALNAEGVALAIQNAGMNAYEHYMQFKGGAGEVAFDQTFVVASSKQISTAFTLTVNTDVATANVFESGQAYTPGGTDRVNTLQDEDKLTGTGDNPTLNATLGNAGDNGDRIITPELNGIETVNVAFTGSGAMAVTALDLQDASGVKAVNVSRITQAVNSAEVGNIREAIANMSLSNTQANQNGTMEFSFANGVLAGENTGTVSLNNISIATLNVGQNTSGIALRDVGVNGYENLTIESKGAANTVATMNLPMDTGTNGTITITGDQALNLSSSSATVNPATATLVEATRYDGGIQGNYGRLAAVDASGLAAGLTLNIAAGMLSTGKADTSGQPQNVTITGTAKDDTFYLNDTVNAGDAINGGEGTDKLVFTNNGNQNIAAAATPNLTNIDAFEIRTGHDANTGVPAVDADTVNVDADAFDALASVYVRNEGQAVVGGWTSAAEAMTVNLNDLTAEQAQAITLAHGTTGNSDIQNNNLNVNLKVATGAADAAQVTIVDGVNTDPVFNARIAAAAVERVTLVDSDTESNTIHLNQGAFTKAGSSITAKGGAANQYMSLDSFNGQSGAAGIVNVATGNGYGYATDGTTGNNTSVTAAAARDAAVSTVFYGTVGAAADNVTRHVVENVDASEYAGDFVIRVGELTRADGTTSMNIKTGAGNDTVIFDAIGSTSAGFTSGDTVAMGAGTDTLVLDGNTATIPGAPRIDHQASEWDNLSGIDVLRFGNNAGVANVGNGAQVANAGGAYYARIDNDFVSQTDAGNRLTVINNDGDLTNNSESDLVLDLRGLSQDKLVTFVGANGNGGAGISSNRIVVDDISANRNMILDGGDTDTANGTGNNNVYEVRNTANVSINDLAQTSNFGLINFTNDQAVAQTLTLTLNNTVIEALVDSSSTATTAATQEILRVVADDNGLFASALNIDARDVTGFHALNVTGSAAGDDVLTLNSNVGGSTTTAALLGGAGDRVNWTGGSATTTVAINLAAVVGNHVFTDGAVTTTHSIDGEEIVDLSGLTYATANVAGTAAAETVVAGGGVDTIALSGGANVVVFGNNSSGITLATADVITDFSAATYKLSMGVAGDATALTGNYVELADAGYADFAAVLAAANVSLATLAATSAATELFVFAHDSTAGDGYLFNDTNGDGTADQVVVLTGIPAAGISAADIIA